MDTTVAAAAIDVLLVLVVVVAVVVRRGASSRARMMADTAEEEDKLIHASLSRRWCLSARRARGGREQHEGDAAAARPHFRCIR